MSILTDSIVIFGTLPLPVMLTSNKWSESLDDPIRILDHQTGEGEGRRIILVFIPYVLELEFTSMA